MAERKLPPPLGDMTVSEMQATFEKAYAKEPLAVKRALDMLDQAFRVKTNDKKEVK